MIGKAHRMSLNSPHMDRAADIAAAGTITTAGAINWGVANDIAGTIAGVIACFVGIVTIWYYITKARHERDDRDDP